MRLEVLKQFHDKNTGACYKAGSVIEVSNERGAEILAAPGELAMEVKAEPAEKEPDCDELKGKKKSR